MVCKNCGFDNKSNQNFCRKCGFAIAPDMPLSPTDFREGAKKTRVFLISLVCLLALCIAATVFLAARLNRRDDETVETNTSAETKITETKKSETKKATASTEKKATATSTNESSEDSNKKLLPGITNNSNNPDDDEQSDE